MEWLAWLFFGWWFWGCDGQRKTADAADSYARPILLVVLGSCLVALFAHLAMR